MAFRLVNGQKDRVRKSGGDCYIWGDKAKVMQCRFKTADGREHETLLLLSGKNIIPFMDHSSKRNLELATN